MSICLCTCIGVDNVYVHMPLYLRLCPYASVLSMSICLCTNVYVHMPLY